MERLSIRQASEQFNISKARLYKLLENEIVTGHRSMKKGRGANSWIDINSLQTHINTRIAKQGHGKGGQHQIVGDGVYLSVREAAKKTGYTTQHIYFLVKQGSIGSKKASDGKGRLVHYSDLTRHKK